MYIYFLTNTIMPNRDGTWPQGKGTMSGKWMWACKEENKEWKNLPFWSWQWKRCCKWMRRWMGNRWNDVVEEWKEKTKKEEA